MQWKSQQPRSPQPELVASKDASRPVLTRVHLDATAGTVTATDSYMLVRCPVEVADTDTTGEVPREALKASRKPPVRNGAPVEISVNGDARVVQGDGDPFMTVPRAPFDYQFPNAEALFPDGEPAFEVSFNAAFLAQLAKAMGNEVVRLAFAADDEGRPNPLRPIIVKPGDYQDGDPDGLLMPVRISR